VRPVSENALKPPRDWELYAVAFLATGSSIQIALTGAEGSQDAASMM
jgi:hypothetical protein